MVGWTVANRDGTVTWASRCPRCHELSSVPKLNPFAVNSWLQGMHVAEAFPQLTATQRETLMSGLHDTCFELYFSEE